MVTVNTATLQYADAPGGKLDKNAYLKLLLTQLQYQDPTNPLQDKDFIAQLAQFTSLEQMTNMNESLEKYLNYQNKILAVNMAFSVVGKYVAIQTTDDKGNPQYITGKVDSLQIKDGKYQVKVNGQNYDIWSVSMVSNEPIDLESLPSEGNTNTSSEETNTTEIPIN